MSRGHTIPPHIAKALVRDLSIDFGHYARDTMSMIEEFEGVLEELYVLRGTEAGRAAYESTEQVASRLELTYTRFKERAAEFERYYQGLDKYHPRMHGAWVDLSQLTDREQAEVEEEEIEEEVLEDWDP